MKLQKFNTKPKNPKHFLAMLFKEARVNPELRDGNDYLVLIKDFGSKALFKSFYGYFLVAKDRTVLSKEFIQGLERP